MQIDQYIEQTHLFEKTEELLAYISDTYHLPEAKEEFVGYFSKFLQKYFGFLTFENAHNAFELNSFGYLNDYLPGTGYFVDNKIKGFSLQSLSKILRAFLMAKKIKPDEKTQKSGLSDEQKNAARHEWVESLVAVFEKYRDKKELTHIGLPAYTCKVLAMHGVINLSEIDTKERGHDVHSRFSHMDNRLGKKTKLGVEGPNLRLKNVQLIYNAFDELIEQQQELAPLLERYKNEFSLINEMPL